MFKSVVHSNAEALQAINGLYLQGDLHLDTCFRNGAFYKNSGLWPEIKQDIKPSKPGILKIDVTKMQHPHCSVRSVMFDPPWLINGEGSRLRQGLPQLNKRISGLISGPVNCSTGNKLGEKYGSFRSAAEMFAFQDSALFEISRCLIPGGWLITKLQDCTYGRQKYFLSVYQVIKARELGLDLVDSIVLVGGHRYRSAAAGRLTSISQHCFFMVYRKASRRKRIIRY